MGLLKIFEQDLLEATEETEFFLVLKDIPRRQYSAKELIDVSLSKFSSVDNKRIISLRSRFFNQVKEKLERKERERKIAEKKRKEKHKKWEEEFSDLDACIADGINLTKGTEETNTTPEPPPTQLETSGAPDKASECSDTPDTTKECDKSVQVQTNGEEVTVLKELSEPKSSLWPMRQFSSARDISIKIGKRTTDSF